jgi:hypothetical protein
MKPKLKKAPSAQADGNSLVMLLLDEVSAVKRRQDSLEEMVGCIADANDNLRARNMAKIGPRRRRAQVYLAINGVRHTNDIKKIVKTQRQNVDKEMRALRKDRLIDIADDSGRGTIYRKLVIDRMTGLSHDLIEKFGLDEDGRLQK